MKLSIRVLILPIIFTLIFSAESFLNAEPVNTKFDPNSLISNNYNSKVLVPVEDPIDSFLKDEEIQEGQVKELGVNDFIRDTFISYTATWAVRFFYVRNKDSRIFDTCLECWWDNITQWPEFDDDDNFFTNFVTHPVIGAVQYLYYRSMGWGFWGSFLGAAVQSTLFEYTIEGTVETPSATDLIATPLIGAPLGFFAETVSDWLITRDSQVAKFAAHIINPMRNFVHDRKVVLLNPLTGHFEFSGPFTINASKDKAIELSYPYFFESPMPLGRFTGFIEAADMKNNLGGGEFVFYHVRMDFPSSNGLWGLYLRISQAGVENITVGDDVISSGYEFANILLGGKSLLYKTHNSVVSGGLDLILPTAYKDNVGRLETLIMFGRDFPLYLQKAWTFTPYLAAAAWKRWYSIQANIGVDFVTRAEKLEGNDFELRFKYSAAAGVNVPIPTTPILFVEFDGYTLATATSLEKTDLFITSGIRFGEKFSPGLGVQIPLSGPTSEIANVSFMADIQLRF